MDTSRVSVSAERIQDGLLSVLSFNICHFPVELYKSVTFRRAGFTTHLEYLLH